MYIPRGSYSPPAEPAPARSSHRYEPRTTSDQATDQAQRWEAILRLRTLFVQRPAAGLQLLDEAFRRGGPEAELILLAAREACVTSGKPALLRGVIELLVRLDRTREAFELARRLVRDRDAQRDDLIRLTKLAARCGLKDQARQWLVRAGVPGVAAVPPPQGEEERSDELGP